MKLHLPVSLRKCVLLAMIAATGVNMTMSASGAILNSDVSMEVYCDFGQNRGNYRTDEQANAILKYKRQQAGGVVIYYQGGQSPYTLAHGMIDYSGVSDTSHGAFMAVGYNTTVTVQHNGVLGGVFTSDELGKNNSIFYQGIEYRIDNSETFLHSPYGGYDNRNNGGFDDKVTRMSKVITDVNTGVLFSGSDDELLENYVGKLLYRAGGGTMKMYNTDTKQTNGLAGGYVYTTGGIDEIRRIVASGKDGIGREVQVEFTYNGSGFNTEREPIPFAAQQGDSGSPSFVYNENTGQYEFIGSLSTGTGLHSNYCCSIDYIRDTLNAYDKAVTSTSDINELHLTAVNIPAEIISSDNAAYNYGQNNAVSTTVHRGQLLDKEGNVLQKFAGVRNGISTWKDLSPLINQDNWYAYDNAYLNAAPYITGNNATAGKELTYADLFVTENLVFNAAIAQTDIILESTVDLGIGYARFCRGKDMNEARFDISSADEGKYQFNHAGYVIDAGVEVHTKLTGDASHVYEWRKIGEGDLHIEGTGNNMVLLNLGGKGKNYLSREGGYAAYNVLANTGTTVVIQDIDQIARDFTFGNLGATLDMNGNSMVWNNDNTDVSASGFTIHALDEHAVIANLKSQSETVLTWTQSGNRTYLGSFADNGKDSKLLFVYDGGTDSSLTLNSIRTNLSTEGSGMQVNSGSLILSGTVTVHGLGSQSGKNTNRLVKDNDWHYADASTDVTVKAGAVFELGSHARLTGDVTVEAGGSYVMREGVKDRYEYVEGGVILEDTYIYRDFYGHKGDVALWGEMLVQFAEGTTAHNVYEGDIFGSGSLSLDLGTQGGVLILAGNNSSHSGNKYLVSGGLVAMRSESLGDTQSHLWMIEKDGWIASHEDSGAELLNRIHSGSTGTLALSENTDKQLDLMGHTALYIGAELGKTVQYGTAGEILDAVHGKWKLGGGGGELVVNFLLTGNNSLVLGASGESIGTVTLTNADNNFTGGITFNSTGIILNAVEGALGGAKVALAYGNAFTLSEAGSVSNVKPDSDGILLIDKAKDFDLDLSLLGDISIGAGEEITYSHNLTLAEGGAYRFSAVAGGLLDITAQLSDEHNIIVDAQGLRNGAVKLSGNECYAGNITVQGHRYHDGSGEIRLMLGRDMVVNGDIMLYQGGLFDVAGHRLTLTKSTVDYGGAFVDSERKGAVIFDTSGGEISTLATLSVQEVRKVGDYNLILGGNNNFGAFYLDEGTLVLSSSDAVASDSVVYLSDGTLLDVGAHSVSFNICMEADMGTSSLIHTGADSTNISGDIVLGAGTRLNFASDSNYTFTGTQYGGNGASMSINGGTIKLRNANSQSFTGTLQLNEDVRVESSGSAEDMVRSFDEICIGGGTVTLWEESWNTIWNIGKLSGEGALVWDSNTTHDYTSRLVLDGDGDFRGTITLDRKFDRADRTHGAFIELAADAAAKNAVISLRGKSKNAVASLAVNTSNAQIKGLDGLNAYSYVYAGASMENAALSGENRPETTRKATLTIDTDAGKTFTYAGVLGNPSDTVSNGLSIYKAGSGVQNFTGVVTVDSLTVRGGTLSIKEATVLGNVSVGQGATLILADYELDGGKTFSVIGGESGATGAAVFAGSLSLAGGALSFDGSALSEDGSAALQLNGLNITSGIGEQRIIVSGMESLTLGKTYTLATGDWTGVLDMITAENLSYYSASFSTSSEGWLQLTLGMYAGSSVWDGDDESHVWNGSVFGHSAAVPTELAQFNDTASNKNVLVATDGAVKQAWFSTSGTYTVASAGGVATAASLQLSGGGVLELQSGIKVTGDVNLQDDSVLLLKQTGLIDGAVSGAGVLEIDWGIGNSDAMNVAGLTSIRILSGNFGVKFAGGLAGTDYIELSEDAQLSINSNQDNTITSKLIAGAPIDFTKTGGGVLTWAPHDGEALSFSNLNISAGGIQLVHNKGVSEIASLSGNGQLKLTGTGTSRFISDGAIGKIYAKRGTLQLSDGACVTVGKLEAGDSNNEGDLVIDVASGATLKVTGSDSVGNYKETALLISEWNSYTTLNVEGSLLAQNASLLIGDGGAAVNVSGTLAVKGIANGRSDKNGGTLSLNLRDGAKLILGSVGFNTGKQVLAQLGAGTIGISEASVTIAEDLILNSVSGTIFDTTRYVIGDKNVNRGSVAGVLTVSGQLLGTGTLVTAGSGTLVLSGSREVQAGQICIDAGTLGIDHGNEENAQITIHGITGDGNLQMMEATTATLNVANATVGSISLYGGTTNINGLVETGALRVGKASLNINEGGILTTASLRGGTDGNDRPSAININGGELRITGTVNNGRHDNSFMLAHWKRSQNILTLNDGVLNATGAVMYTSFDSVGIFKALGGEAYLKGISFDGQAHEYYGRFELGSSESGSAVVHIGSEGIKNLDYNAAVVLGEGMLTADADFAVNGTNAVQLVGQTGTIINTTGHTVTFNAPVEGSGKLHVRGGGKVALYNNVSLTDLTILSGSTVAVSAASGKTVNLASISGSGTLVKNGNGRLLLGDASLAYAELMGNGETEISGDVAISGILSLGKGSVELVDGADVVVSRFVSGNMQNDQPSRTTISAGATLTITGEVDTDAASTSFLLAHWKRSASSLVLNGGNLVAENTCMHMGWDSSGTFEAHSGEATLKGIRFNAYVDPTWGRRTNVDSFILGTVDSGSARVNIGSGGILNIAQEDIVNFGNGTIAATADFSITGNKSINFIAAATGTVIDTADYTITIDTPLAGSGDWIKQGNGTLVLNGSTGSFTGNITVDAGVLALSNKDAASILSNASSLVLNDGAVLDLSGITFGTDISGALGLSVSSGFTNGVINMGDITQAGTYYIFTGVEDADLTAANFSANGVVLSRYEDVQVNIVEGVLSINFGSLSYTSLDNLLWNGGSNGIWDTGRANWDNTPSQPADSIVFTNGDSVTFVSDVHLQVVDGVSVNNITINEGVTLNTDGNLMITGKVNMGSGSTYCFSGGAELSFTEAELNAMVASDASLVVGDGATLTMTHKETTENQISSAFDCVSGTGKVMLHLEADNGIGFNLSGISGDIEVVTGRLQVNTTSFNDAATIYLSSADAQLVFDDIGTVLNNNVVLQASTTIHVNNTKSGTIAGIVSGNAGLTKAGRGELTFTTQNAYTGATTISDGKIILDTNGNYMLHGNMNGGLLEVAKGTNLVNDSHEISSALVLQDGAFASLNGNCMLKGNITVNANACLTFHQNDTMDWKASGKTFTLDGGVVDFGSYRQSINSGWSITLKNGAILMGSGGEYSDTQSGVTYFAALDLINENNTITVESGENVISANIGLRKGNSGALTFNVAEGASIIVNGRIQANGDMVQGNIVKDGEGDALISSRALFNKISTKGGKLELTYQGDNTVNTLDGYAGGTGSGILHIAGGSRLNVNSIIGSRDSAVEIAKGGRLCFGDFLFAGRDLVSATLSATTDNAMFDLASSAYVFSSGYLMSHASADTIVGNKLQDVFVENSGSGHLTLNHAENTIIGIAAITADITMFNNTVCMLNGLTIADDRTVAVYTGESQDSTVGNIVLSGRGEIADGASLLANLELLNGSVLRITNTSTTEGASASPIHSLSGVGTVELYFATGHNTFDINFEGFSGDIVLASGSMDVADSALSRDSVIKLDSSESRLVFNAPVVDIVGDIELNKGRELFVTEGNQGLISGAISGKNGLLKTGSGILTITSQKTYTGTTTIEDGTLVLANGTDYILYGNVEGEGTLEVGAGTILNNNGKDIGSALVLNAGAQARLDRVMSSSSVSVNAGAELRYEGTRDGITHTKHYGEGSISVALSDNWNNIINWGNQFNGETYVRRGNMTLPDSYVGDTLRVADGVNIQFKNIKGFCDANLILEGNSILSAWGGGDFSLNGTVMSTGIYESWGAGTVHFNDVLNLGGLKKTKSDASGLLNIYANAVIGSVEMSVGSLAIRSGITEVGKAEISAGQVIVDGGNLKLTGTGFEHQIAKLEVSLANATAGEVHLGEDVHLKVTSTLKSSNGSAVVMKQGASLAVQHATFSNKNGGEAKLKSTNTNSSTYGLGSVDYELENGHFTFNATSQATVKNKLTNSSVQNDCKYNLVLDHTDNILTGIFAEGGNINVQNQASRSLSLQELKVAAGLTVGAYTGSSISASDEALIKVSQMAQFGHGATLNADLVMQSGATLQMDGTVTMGSDLTLMAGLTLTGSQYEAVRNLIADGESKVVLFEGIDKLILGDNEYTASITMDKNILAHTYFGNIGSDYLLVYDATVPGNGVLSIMAAVPEPSTATLSLLALAALAARRRRR